MKRNALAELFKRPSGTPPFPDLTPGDESLGYFHGSLPEPRQKT
jgi:hypothetical protein